MKIICKVINQLDFNNHNKHKEINAIHHSRKSSLSSQNNDLKGFTAIEATVVILIVGVLLAILVFGYVRFLAGTAVETASKDIAATMNLAREMSISVNSTHRVTIQLNDPEISGRQAYWIDRLSYDTVGNPVWQIQVTNIHFVPDRVRITDVAESESMFEFIEFRPSGTAEPRNVHLINKSEDTTNTANFFTVEVIPSTARAKILRYERR